MHYIESSLVHCLCSAYTIRTD